MKEWVAMAQLYHVYLDESGTHAGSEAVAVAGFVSNASKWEAFSEQWSAALKEWGISAFHMTDFESRHGEFANWKNEERKERLNRLLNLIIEHTFSSIGYVIRKKSFDEILSDSAKKLCADAYGMAAIGCWYTLAVRAKRPTIDGWFDYIMEAGCKGGSALHEIWRIQVSDEQWLDNTRMRSLDFRPKQKFPPLQAADILAYELFKQAQRQFGNEQRPPRYPLKRLNTPGRQWHYAEDDELTKMNEYLTDLYDRLVSGS